MAGAGKAWGARTESVAIAVGFFAAALVMVLTAWATSVALRRLNEISLRVQREHAALAALADLREELLAAELSVRGYVVTGELPYLRQYQSAIGGIPARWDQVRSFSAGSDHLSARLAALEPLVARKLAALRGFAAFDGHRAPPAVAVILIDRNQRSMEAVAAQADQIVTEAQGELGALLGERAATAREAFIISRLQGVAGVAMIVLIFLAFLRQTSLRRRAEEESAGSAELLSLVFNSAAEGVIVADAQGRAVIFNPAAEVLFGGRPEAARTGRWTELRGLYHVDGISPLEPGEMPLVRAMNGEATDGLEVCIKRPGTKDCAFISLTGRPLRSEDGALRGGAVVFSDVTARKRADAEIRRLNRDLQSSLREMGAVNRELENFTYSVSHGLRAPLRAVDGFARLLERRLEPADAEGKRLLGVIQTSTRRMGTLMDDLLAYTDLGRRPLRLGRVELEPIVRRAFEEALRAEGPSRAELALSGLPAASADPDMIREAWRNLMSNAVKFSARAAHPRVEVGTAGGNGKTIYFIRDNGVGFNMRYAHRLFGVFQRLHGTDEFEGSGVGLAIVKRIVERHGGQIWAQAEEGVGATFYLTLSTAPEEPYAGGA